MAATEKALCQDQVIILLFFEQFLSKIVLQEDLQKGELNWQALIHALVAALRHHQEVTFAYFDAHIV